MTPNERTLLDMLSYCRPMGSRTETAFLERFILSIPGAYHDCYGNVHVERGTDPRVLFSAHTDTVHTHGGRQRIAYSRGIASVPMSRRKYRRNCLGADDTAGCYILRALALADVPGHYVFHFGEERGGIGSSALANHCATWLATSFDHAIAFDRRGRSDIITHQAGSRSASTVFARALADRLNAANRTFRYAPSSHGIYTDTAEYVDLIPECTNVSVGYLHEHSDREVLDIRHVLKLVEALTSIDYSTLPVDRDPNALDDDRVLDDWSLWRATATMDLDQPIIRIVGGCDYLDPEWELIQRTLARADGRVNRTGE